MTTPEAPKKSRARTFTRVEMEDAARLAAEHGLTVRLQRDGDLVLAPANAPLDSDDENSAESLLNIWKAKRGKAAGRAHH